MLSLLVLVAGGCLLVASHRWQLASTSNQYSTVTSPGQTPQARGSSFLIRQAQRLGKQIHRAAHANADRRRAKRDEIARGRERQRSNREQLRQIAAEEAKLVAALRTCSSRA